MQIRIKALNVKKGCPVKLGVLFMNFLTEHVRGVAVKAYFPIADDVSIEITTEKHLAHISHIGHIPLADITIERTSFEHSAHIGHIGHIPLADITIERGTEEHPAHSDCFGHIPPA